MGPQVLVTIMGRELTHVTKNIMAYQGAGERGWEVQLLVRTFLKR
jgi:hypothetical protein